MIQFFPSLRLRDSARSLNRRRYVKIRASRDPSGRVRGSFQSWPIDREIYRIIKDAIIILRERTHDNCDKLTVIKFADACSVTIPQRFVRPFSDREKKCIAARDWETIGISCIRRSNAGDFGGGRTMLRDRWAGMRSLLNPRAIGVTLLRRTYDRRRVAGGAASVGKWPPCSRIALIWGNAHRKTRKKHYVTFKRVCICDGGSYIY